MDASGTSVLLFAPIRVPRPSRDLQKHQRHMFCTVHVLHTRSYLGYTKCPLHIVADAIITSNSLALPSKVARPPCSLLNPHRPCADFLLATSGMKVSRHHVHSFNNQPILRRFLTVQTRMSPTSPCEATSNLIRVEKFGGWYSHERDRGLGPRAVAVLRRSISLMPQVPASYCYNGVRIHYEVGY